MQHQPAAAPSTNGEVDPDEFDRNLQDILKDALRGAAQHYEDRSKQVTDKKKASLLSFNSRRCYAAIGDISQMRFDG